MSIPTPFNPLGTLGGMLPYLPADFPFRADVIDGVWFGRLVSTGSMGDPEIPALNPPRIFYDSPFKTEINISPCLLVVKGGIKDGVTVQYSDTGMPLGGYLVNKTRIGAFGSGKQCDDDIIESSVFAIMFDGEVPTFCLPDNFERKSFPIIYNTTKNPQRANKLLYTSTNVCGLFFRRTMSGQELKTILEYVTQKQQ